MQTLTVACIDNEYGLNLTAFATEAEAYDYVADYCREWWEDVELDGPADPPENNAECVTQYFNHCTKSERCKIETFRFPDTERKV